MRSQFIQVSTEIGNAKSKSGMGLRFGSSNLKCCGEIKICNKTLFALDFMQCIGALPLPFAAFSTSELIHELKESWSEIFRWLTEQVSFSLKIMF